MWKIFPIICLLLIGAVPRASGFDRRLAIDIGSSSIKVRIAEVSKDRRSIFRTLYQNTYRVPFHEEVESSGTRELSKKVKTQVRDIVAQNVNLARSLGAREVAAVATISLENAKNMDTLIADIEKASGIQVKFITPIEEAIIGFEGAAAQSNASRQDLIVWDLGGTTSEIVTLSRKAGYLHYENDTASITFANKVLTDIKRENPQIVTTANPLTQEQIDRAVKLAADQMKRVPAPIKEKIMSNHTAVIGIGALPFLALKSLGPTHTRDEIRESLYEKADLKDNQLMSLYPQHVVTNLALTLGTMEELGMKRITLEVVDLTSGLVLLSDYLQPLEPIK